MMDEVQRVEIDGRKGVMAEWQPGIYKIIFDDGGITFCSKAQDESPDDDDAEEPDE